MAEEQNDTATAEEKKLDVKVEDVGPARKKLTIVIPEEQVQEKLQDNFETLTDQAVLPGFRRGRAPKRLIEKRFGKTIKDDAKTDLITEAYQAAVDQEGLEVLGEPVIKNLKKIELPESGPLEFNVEVEITPDIQLPDYEGIELEEVETQVADEDLDKEIDTLRERYGKMQPVEDAQVKEGDFVQAHVVIRGQQKVEDPETGDIPEGESVLQDHPTTYILVPGESREFKGHVAGIVIEDLGKKLEGKKAGDEVEIEMTGPASHEDDNIRGNDIKITINISNVQRLEPAPVEDLLSSFGLESEDVLRDELRQSLEARREREAQESLRNQVRDYLTSNVDLELPEGLTGRQTARVLQRQAMEMSYRGSSDREIEQAIAERRSEGEEEARKQLKAFFVLNKAADELEIDVKQGELNSLISMMAQQQGRRPEKVRQQLMRSGEIDQLYMYLREQKTLDAILEKVRGDKDESSDEGEAKTEEGGEEKSE